ncbi:VanZ family protein [Streptomyces tateyamensis]|uniref:VanZ family protein n=1 Tax=Streptomyces tateyamensis TaxID=565073 RepID=UPI0015E8DABD|nr:VanZ family protein [Streptomyces tateyamensis]
MQRDGTGRRQARDGVRISDRRQGQQAPPDGSGPPAPALPRDRELPLRSLGLVLIGLYFLLLCWLAVRQAPPAWAYDANLTPFASVQRSLADGDLDQLLGALAPAAPLGVLVPLAGGRLRTAWFPSFVHATACAALVATGFEGMRTALGDQVLNVDDILLGVIGAALAHLLVVPVGRAALRGRPARPTAPLREDPEPDPQIPADRPGETRGSRIGIRMDA